MFKHYVYSMITVLLLFVWLAMFIGGIGLLFASKYFKTGIMLTTLFFTPIVLLFLLLWNVGPYDCWMQC